MMRSSTPVKMLCLSFAVLHLLSSVHAGELSLVYQEGRLLMGMVVTLTIPTDEPELARLACQRAFEAMEEVDRCMSLYRPDSELSRLNHASPGRAIPLSNALFTVIEAAFWYAELTEGAFDVTVAPAMRAWGFMSEDFHVPGSEELERVRPMVGYKNIRLDGVNKTVQLLKEGVEIDLGAIAKGYAIDVAKEALMEAGFQDAMIDAGGDIYVLGRQPGQDGWNVGVRHPANEHYLLTSLKVTDRAVATSGNSARYFVRDGVSYGHILDPRTLRPVRGMLSTSVIAPTAMMADALATAIFVMGPEEGLKLIHGLSGVEAIVCAGKDPTGADMRVFLSKGLRGKVEILEHPASVESLE